MRQITLVAWKKNSANIPKLVQPSGVVRTYMTGS